MGDPRDAWYAYVDLTHRYAAAVDRGDGPEVAALFADDGRWDGRAFGLPVLAGHDALVPHFSGDDDQPASVHLVHNHLVHDVSASRLTAHSYAHALLPREDRVRHLVVGYDDVLTLAGDQWRFSERVLRRALSF